MSLRDRAAPRGFPLDSERLDAQFQFREPGWTARLLFNTRLDTFRAMSSKRLTDQERRGLCEVLYHAFIELRGMGSPERAHQASKLAYALHNLPHLLFTDDFAWEKVEGPLRYYQDQFYQTEAARGYDYLRMIAQVRNGESVSP